jgi:hypothetical protein
MQGLVPGDRRQDMGCETWAPAPALSAKHQRSRAPDAAQRLFGGAPLTLDKKSRKQPHAK